MQAQNSEVKIETPVIISSIVLNRGENKAIDLQLIDGKLFACDAASGRPHCPGISVFNKEACLLLNEERIVLSMFDINDNETTLYFDETIDAFVPVVDRDLVSGEYSIFDIRMEELSLTHTFTVQ